MSWRVPNGVYLDNNATTRPLPEVRTAVLEVLGEGFGNPSSAHSGGSRARGYLRQAREAVAALIGADPTSVVFTSGATETNTMVLASAVRDYTSPSRLVTSKVEHSSVLKACEHLEGLGVELAYLQVDRTGRVSLEDLERLLQVNPAPALVSIQWVNNETGVVQPIEEIGRLCREHGVLFHTDAAQAVGKLHIDVSSLHFDFLSLTAHKYHGPPGVGGLYARESRWLRPLLFGGPQEAGLRPGTENLPGIVGMGMASALRRQRLNRVSARLGELRDQFESLVLQRVPEAQVNGDRRQRVSNTTNILFRELDGQALVARLDQMGICCSQSSACTNARPEPSYVLKAMGLTEDEAYSSVRFAFSEENTLEEVGFVVEKIVELSEKLRAFSCAPEVRRR